MPSLALASLLLHAWPLQTHCGVQELARGEGFLRYGQLVYRLENGRTEIARFETVSASGAPHPFCAVIQGAMDRQHPLRLELSSRGGWWELTDVAEK